MTLGELITEIEDRIQDDSYTRDTIRSLVNQACKRIASRILLPDLKASSTVYAGRAYLSDTTISFDASTSRISDAENRMITSGFHVGDTVEVNGSSSNDGSYTVTAVTAAYLTISGALVDEVAGESVTLTNQGPNYVSLPSDYMRNLYKCYNQTISWYVTIYPNHRSLFALFPRPDLCGNILHVAPQGQQKLYYQLIPSTAQALLLDYYRYPRDMMDYDEDEPDGIPEEFQTPLIVNMVCRDIFERIEDGVDGQKTNTLYYDAQFKEALQELKLFIGPEAKEPERIGLFHIDWDAYH